MNMNDTATVNAECKLSLSPQEARFPAAFITELSIQAVCCLIALWYQASVQIELQLELQAKAEFPLGSSVKGQCVCVCVAGGG